MPREIVDGKVVHLPYGRGGRKPSPFTPEFQEHLDGLRARRGPPVGTPGLPVAEAARARRGPLPKRPPPASDDPELPRPRPRRNASKAKNPPGRSTMPVSPPMSRSRGGSKAKNPPKKGTMPVNPPMSVQAPKRGRPKTAADSRGGRSPGKRFEMDQNGVKWEVDGRGRRVRRAG